ncbi:MAG: mechanosensitive ion channel family protein [Gemmatimonadetes bacterium]|nr:mechanosensitive ion channel family protein [Gemmatimonadota bacterium]
MTFLESTLLGNTLASWMAALALAGAVLVGLRVLKRVLGRRLAAVAERTRSPLDDLAADLVGRTKGLFLLLLALYAGSQALTLPRPASGAIRAVAVLALLVQGALWANGVISFWITRQMRKRMQEDAAAATSIAALHFLSRLVLWSVVLLLALDNLGVDVTALVAGLGVGGIAVALAAQNILGDLFACLSIVLDKPFVIGDFIIVGDQLGTVEHIGLKTTRVRSLWGEQLVFSNGDLLGSRIRNFGRMYQRRVVFAFGVTYQTAYEKLAAIPGMVREIIEAQEHARFDRAHFKEFGDSALNFEVVYYVTQPDYNLYMDIQQAINLALVRRFEEEAIEFAYPTRTLYVVQEALKAASP